MAINVLDVSAFRNIGRAQVEFSPRLTLLVGSNGQGKTNLLEAVYVLLQGRDFRTAQEREAIQEGEPVAWLQATGEIQGRPETWRHRIQRQPSRRTHQGPVVPVVLFSPDDVYLAKGSPERRRRFLDLLLAPHDRHYARSIRAYHRLLLQRNRALKEAALQTVVDDFTPLLVKEGLYIWQRRRETLAALLPLAMAIHSQLAPGEALETALKFGGSLEPIADEGSYYQLINARRGEERARQTTLVGPHRDDVVFRLNQRDTTLYASQGQLRTLALSTKLATHRWLWNETGIRPIILLDDVLSELDSARREALLAAVSTTEQQTIVTDTEPRSYASLEPKILHVERGDVRAWNPPPTRA
ncbi:DNA replication and repair protein RecF [Sulfobacillus sp. DSM 109850]|uniref:DNA replication and repair protein RecF n=2 Tax=Sulfobacillus harzensis TaxID=2729629 RepID=A0A7Y0Q284_9FIRM|nr:DNA replication and repair protein RecF [Sulfobacillus harzensis]